MAAIVKTVPLCVDLDGTLVQSDTLHEATLVLLKQNILYIFLLPFWLIKGRSFLKQEVAKRSKLNVDTLPYNADLLAYLESEKSSGRYLVLTTAADYAIANSVANHLGLFDEVLASDGKVNLKAARKLESLKTRFGDGAFDYAGDSSADLPVWREARNAILVNAGSNIARQLQSEGISVHRSFETNHSRVRAAIRAIRPHQWAKNLLLFVPPILAHSILHEAVLFSTILGFIAFCCCASAVYLLNDLLDLESDRRHHSKRSRPFAAGQLSIPVGFGMAAALFAAAIACSAFLHRDYQLVLLAYVVVTFLYSFFLKKLVLIDVMVLAGLYAIRLLAGGAAAQVPISPWLLGYALFLFLSLAMTKRITELQAMRSLEKTRTEGRGYLADDLEQLSMMSAASGYIAGLVLALYVYSPHVAALYRNPQVLWIICLLHIYWISRVNLLCHRGLIDEDPILFAVKDKATIAIGGLALVVIFLAL
jgi:4-hydroxybenzoate polyprenyltransferase